MSDDRYDRVTFRGHTVDRWTMQALMTCEKVLGYELTIVQGSYNGTAVSASAGTHAGAGVVDLAPADWQNKVRVLRQNGFAAWHRLPSQGPWGEHIHAVLVGDEKAAPSALRQVVSYREGRNGLANNARDDGPRPAVIKEFPYRATPERKPGMNQVQYARMLFEAGLAELRKAKGRHAAAAMAATITWALKVGPKK